MGIICRFLPHARPIADARNSRIAVVPADSRVVVFYEVKDSTKFWIKGEKFTIKELLQNNEMTKKFEGGAMAICRLAPMDFHRFLAPVTCKVGTTTPIDGDYFLDIPIVVRENVDVFTGNVRTVMHLKKTPFGDIAYVCVGSTMVGSVQIGPQKGDTVKKGDELGYFKFGGSTIILLFEKDKIIFANDLETNTAKPVETYCWMGSPLGIVRNK